MQTFSYPVFSSENNHLLVVKLQEAHYGTDRNRCHVKVFSPYNVHDKVEDFIKV